MDFFFVLQALWLFLPAYNANMAPVFAMKMFPRWNTRLDGGRTHRDGRPLLGAGKTYRGLVAGALAGTLSAWAQSTIRFTSVDFSDFAYTATGGLQGPLVLGFLLGTGAIVGDAAKSYFKRRRGKEGGAPWFPFDQLDFVLGGLLFVLLGAWLLCAAGQTTANWWSQEFLGSEWPKLVVLLVATPLLHWVVNVIGYRLKMKSVPW